jgi:hypothetical protein
MNIEAPAIDHSVQLLHDYFMIASSKVVAAKTEQQRTSALNECDNYLDAYNFAKSVGLVAVEGV